MTTVTVCLATYERPGLLAATLDALRGQRRWPDQVVVVDASHSGAGARATREMWSAAACTVPLLYLRSQDRALPWLRWVGASHATGDLVLFLDDDVLLRSEAIGVLVTAFERLEATLVRGPAGLGFGMAWDDGAPAAREASAWRERWLGTGRCGPGQVTAGGIGVSLTGLGGESPVEVERLWGGAMAFRRTVLERVGLLDRLADLYRRGVGRGEDLVLSSYARAYGPLFALPQPLALHRRVPGPEPTPYAGRGWRLGLTATWGRAHTLRWVATDRTACAAAWARLASLELARSGLGILRRPWDLGHWQRLLGTSVGATRSMIAWRRIPASARAGGPGAGAEAPSGA